MLMQLSTERSMCSSKVIEWIHPSPSYMYNTTTLTHFHWLFEFVRLIFIVMVHVTEVVIKAFDILWSRSPLLDWSPSLVQSSI